MEGNQEIRQSEAFPPHNNQSFFHTDSRIEENKWNSPYEGEALYQRRSSDKCESNGGFQLITSKKKNYGFRCSPPNNKISLEISDGSLSIQFYEPPSTKNGS